MHQECIFTADHEILCLYPYLSSYRPEWYCIKSFIRLAVLIALGSAALSSKLEPKMLMPETVAKIISNAQRMDALYLMPSV